MKQDDACNLPDSATGVEGVPCLELLADEDGRQSDSVVAWLDTQPKRP